MRVFPLVFALLVAASVSLAGLPRARAESPFDGNLLRLAEILGSLHFLRNLCGETGDAWRGRMEALLESENPAEARRVRLVARFNAGYRAFETSYAACTDSALAAIDRYMAEGEELTRETATRFGN